MSELTKTKPATQIGAILSKYTFIYPLIGGIFVVAFAEPTAFSAALGTILIMKGCLLRLHALASQKDRDHLSNSGAYSVVRQPLYLAHALIAVGFFLFTSASWLFVIFSFTTLAIFHYLSIYDEAIQRVRFGSEFDAYSEKTPKWLPVGNIGGEAFQFTRELPVVIRSERPVHFGIFALLVFLCLFQDS